MLKKANELKEDDKKIQILDIREDTERQHAHVQGTIHIKLTEIAESALAVLMVGASTL